MTDAVDDAGADVRDMPSEEAFRQEVLNFLEATLPTKGGEASGVVSFGGSGLSRSVAYQRKLADARLAGITWPAAYGGRGLPGRYQRIYDRESKAFQIPPRSLEIGLGMCGPTLLVHASDEQKKTFIPPLLRGDNVWCELFSEPGAGSDLSSVQTRARRDGDEFVLDGQKVWTSGAQHSDYAACLVRTDPTRPKREGITMLIVDMHVPGITVRPLRQITGESHFNEVFLDEVRVPTANVVGEINDGWRVARSMLAFERQALGNMGGGGGGKGGFAALAEEAKRRDLAERPVLRDHLVQLRIRQMVLRNLTAYLQVKARGRRWGGGLCLEARHGAAGAGVRTRGGRDGRHARHRLDGRRPQRRALVGPAAELAVRLHWRGHEPDRAQRHRRAGARAAAGRGR